MYFFELVRVDPLWNIFNENIFLKESFSVMYPGFSKKESGVEWKMC